MLEILKNWSTARDGVSYSLTKVLAVIAFGMASYKFLGMSSPDLIGYATSIVAILGVLAAKYAVEEPEVK